MMSKSARIFLFASTLALLFLLVSSPARAANLLQNPGFEGGTAGWTKYYPTTTTFEATSSATKSGSFSGLVTKKSSKEWTYIYQEVEATLSAEYKFSGWVYFNDPKVKYVKLRIDWMGGDRKSMGKISEVKLEDRNSEFQELSLTATAPDGSVRARVEAFINLESPNPTDPVLFDDLSFDLVEPLSISFTLPSEVTAGEGFDVPVTVRNADPSGVYYAKTVIGESTESASLRKGYTYNSVLDKWLAWNGSWEDMPTFTTDADGAASFTLKSKVAESAATGTYYYLVRIRKVGTEDNLDSDSQTFSVSAASVTSDTSNSSDPEVTFSVVGDSFKVDQSFDVKVNIKNAKPLHDYYVKIRLGLEEGKLTKGRTYNGFLKDWFADNSSWTNFPVVYTASDGTESVTISVKVASGNPADTYIIGVRIRDKEAEDNFDSATQALAFSEEDPPDLSSEAFLPAEASAKAGAKEGAILGTLTELPATGADTIGLGYLGLSLGLFLRIIAGSYILTCDRR